jgi:hypothetical protein
MKTLLISTLLLLSFSISAQVYIGMDAGRSSLQKVAALNIGYTKNDLLYSPIVEGKMIFHLNFTDPAYFALVAGENYRLNNWTFSVYAGPDYRMQNSDKKSENYFCALAGLRATWKDFHADVYRTNGTNFFTVGYFGSFEK